MLGSDNKPAEKTSQRNFEDKAKSEFSKKTEYGTNVCKSWNVTCHSELYRRYLKLRSIQSDGDGIAELNKGSLNYSEQNKLGEGSYGNVYHGNYEGMSAFVKQFCKKKCNLQNPPVAVIIDFRQSRRINDPKIYHAVNCNPKTRRCWIAPEVYDEIGCQTV